MQALIHGGKFKVMEVLENRDKFKAYLCMDVETNDHYRQFIFNIYEDSEIIKKYLPTFYAMTNGSSSDFIRVLSGPHSITAVFQYHNGRRFTDYFSRLAKEDFAQRVELASKLLETCLILDTVADFIAYAGLCPQNIVVSGQPQGFRFNFVVLPVENIPANFKGEKMAALFRIMFVKNRFLPEALEEFIHWMQNLDCANMAGLFSSWKEIQEQLVPAHQKLLKEKLPAYIIRKMKQWVKEKFTRKRV